MEDAARWPKVLLTFVAIGAPVAIAVLARLPVRAEREVVSAWDSVEVEDAGRRLVVHHTDGQKLDTLRVEVDEHDDRVVLRLVALRTPGDAEAVGYHEETVVTLQEPLGDRRLVDAACSEEHDDLACRPKDGL